MGRKNAMHFQKKKKGNINERMPKGMVYGSCIHIGRKKLQNLIGEQISDGLFFRRLKAGRGNPYVTLKGGRGTKKKPRDFKQQEGRCH